MSSGAAPKRGKRRRDEVIADLTEASRDMAGWTLLLHQAIAAHFGLGPTDMKCLDLARGEPDLTAGRVAEITGLSTSAVTSAIDRLEKRGFVERVRHPADRRKIVIRPTGAHDTEATAIFGRVEDGLTRIVAGYDTATLEHIAAFIRACSKETSALVPRLTAEK